MYEFPHGFESMDAYQKLAATTAIYPEEHKITYPVLGLIGEVGEFANKHKKVIRDGKPFPPADMAAELGDILWYLSAIATDAGLSLSGIAQHNIAKLLDRQARDVIGGSGDTR